jgi:hypothetical protein
MTALVVLAVADVVGVAASFVLDIAPMRHKSAGLGYAIWFVLGAFAGVVHYGSAVGGTDGWASREEARSAGFVLLGVTTAIVAGLVVLFHVSMWRQSTGPEWAVVPDHMPTTIVFLAAFLASTCVAHHAYTPDRPRPS